VNGDANMTSAALNIAKQIDSMTESEVDFIWDVLRKRRNEALLKTVDMKLEESLGSKTLTEEEVSERQGKLGIA